MSERTKELEPISTLDQVGVLAHGRVLGLLRQAERMAKWHSDLRAGIGVLLLDRFGHLAGTGASFREGDEEMNGVLPREELLWMAEDAALQASLTASSADLREGIAVFAGQNLDCSPWVADERFLRHWHGTFLVRGLGLSWVIAPASVPSSREGNHVCYHVTSIDDLPSATYDYDGRLMGRPKWRSWRHCHRGWLEGERRMSSREEPQLPDCPAQDTRGGASVPEMGALDATQPELEALALASPKGTPTTLPAACQSPDGPALGEDGQTGEDAVPEDMRVGPLSPLACHGLAGEFVRLIAPFTEADPVALLVHFLVFFGNLLGRQPHYCISRTGPGLQGEVCARAEVQVIRLSCIYACLDDSPLIRREHLEAAMAVWQYCEASADLLFGGSTGNPLADRIRLALQARPEGLTRTEIRDLFDRHQPAAEIDEALGLLKRLGYARVEKRLTGGRPQERWLYYSLRPLG